VVKLGRVAPRGVPLALSLADYLAPAVAPPATTGDRRKKPDVAAALARMYLNDQEGDCVVASCYHKLGLWAGTDGRPAVQVPDSLVHQMYQQLKAGPGDSGCVITDVLDYWRSSGLPVGNGQVEKIDGYVRVDNTRADQVKAGAYLFGAVKLGIDLPQAWLNSAVWDVTNSPVVGGHDVPIVDYDEKGVYVASWARIYLITWRAFTSRNWVKEAYVPLAPAWYGPDKLAPSGVDADRLRADLAKLGGGEVPDVAPPVSPPPVPPSPPTPPAPTSPDTIRIPAGQTVPAGYVALGVKL
jgi:hypothetical protein